VGPRRFVDARSLRLHQLGVMALQRSRFFVRAATVVVVATACSATARLATRPAGATAGRPPAPNGYFQTLPAGASLPTDALCAARVHRSTWEPRRQNNTANHKIVTPVNLPINTAFNAAWQKKYKPRIDGAFSGTTDEIIQWASCKWGVSDNLTRARAVQESSWVQSTLGDYVPKSSGHCVPGWPGTSCPTSFGLLQSKWYFRPGTYPRTLISTAYNVDSVLAEMRGCLDGMLWFGPRSRGDVWDCTGFWFSGSWRQDDQQYIAHVQAIYTDKPWLRWNG
jgi:hypothetical protein